ncbi:penicillin-binding transpeptidase domain-containing protein [Eubacterium xylanophilum]|uniref:penicillin-binding transpeptidase domain-containing protein n=1 Tax=Eubacterium xylanophilum TaxID=39497 RepID=UPI0004BC5F50|nr:penicillin-binding transpeptidase domain-containing protein [Eubacterium xylanophilum]
MFSGLLDHIKVLIKSRIFLLIIIYIVLFGALIGRLFYLQIVKGEVYEKKATINKEKRRTLKSSRGQIFDCNGKLLASNEQSFAITIEDVGQVKDNTELNNIILKCIKLIEKNGDKISVDFPIEINRKGEFAFNVDENAQMRFKREIYFLNSVDQLTAEQKEMTAAQCFDYIRNSTKVNQIRFFNPEAEKAQGKVYTNEEALDIMRIRYALMMNTYKKYEPVIMSSDVSQETVAAIKENSADLTGVEVLEDSKRVYYNSYYFSHIIGYTGLISSEALEAMKENNDTTYTSTDQIGKTGIEKTYEDVLRGKKGSETLVVDSSSRVVDTKDHVDAKAGDDIYLTIDSDLQKAVYKLTEKSIAGVLISKLTNSKRAGSKGKKADNIKVPIYDAYCAIVENSLVDISLFAEKDASDIERDVYSKFSSHKRGIINRLKSLLSYDNGTHGKALSKSTKSYLDFVYTMLRNDEIIATNKMDKTDATYNAYANGKISLSKFLIYAISNDWIDLDKLDIGDDYYRTEEIYQKMIDYIFSSLDDNLSFDKLIYHTLIYNGTVNGRELCLILYKQGYLKHDKNTEAKLRTGMISPYQFIRSKIKTLEISPGELGLTPCSASVVVTVPNTGQVKSLVSYPSYDNNKFANSVNASYYGKINDNSASPLLNRATQQKTAPGSTYKMVSATAGLEEGIIDPYTTIKDRVEFTKINPSPKCWSSVSHGTINVSQAIQHSCNYFFYELGYRLSGKSGGVVNNEKGLNILKKYADMFGLTSKSGIELSETDPNVSDSDSVRSAIGQGTNSYTPVQLSRYVSTIANGGNCYDLTLINSIYDGQAKSNQKNDAKVRNKLDVKKSTLKAIKNGMYKVVNNGSITDLFKKVNKKVAGKTGTAQISANEPNHALFVSFAPYNNPEISVTVVMPNGFTSSNAASLASLVYQYYYSKDKDARKNLLKNTAAAAASNSGGVHD